MARKIKKGATDISVILRAIDSTTGAPKTDFAYNTAGIDLWYRRNGATVTSITEATLAAADTAHSDGGVIHLGNGYFRLDSPDAAFATGVNSVMFGGTATGVIIIGTEIQLVNYDPEDAVRLGLTALPNAAADAAGGLPISDAGGLDLDTLLATLTNGTYGLSAIETLVDEIESRLTATRAGYLDNLSAAPPTAAAIADAVLDEALSGHQGVGSAGIAITDTLGYVTALRSALTDLRAAALDRVVGTIAAGTHNPQSGDAYAIVNNGTYGNSALETLVDGIETSLAAGVTVTTNNDKTGYALTVTPPTAAQITDAVLDAPLADHLDAGSVGAGINAAGSAGDPWSTTLPGAYGAGTAGKIIGDNVNATISSRSSHSAADVWAVSVRTLSTFGSLVADTATAVWGAVARTITGGTITTVSDKTGYSLTVTPPTAAQVRAEIDSNSTQLAAIVADTAEIQSELADGGRTDLLIDGIKAKTDQLTFTTPNSVDATATVSTAGLATEANQTTIINHLTDVKGATFSGATDSLEAIRNRGDVAWITGGTGGGSNAVTINVKDDSAANVVDCYVEIWDSAGTSFISRTNTNSSGNVTFNLDSNTYIVKMHKTGYYFENQTLVVDGVESVVYTGAILTPDAATDPTLCRIYGYYFDPAGSTYSAVKSLIKLTAIYEASDNNYYTSELVGTYNTTTGLLYFDVIQGASVTLEIPILNVKKSFVVPATTLYKISDIA